MKHTLNIYKPVGKTPYQAVLKVKELYPEYSDIKIGYAGRLDPMAEGVLLLLVGDVNKSKHEYQNLEKTYTFQAVLGMETDTYDVLGIVKKNQNLQITNDSIVNALNSFKGSFEQYYPPYSSVRINGKPLFFWAREGMLDKITIPSKKVYIYQMTDTILSTIPAEKLANIIYKKIRRVQGNFRQKEIKNAWKLFFEKNKSTQFTVVESSIRCSSGTYVRSLVHNLGKKSGLNATTLSIKRTSVGEFRLEDSEDIFKENTK